MWVPVLSVGGQRPLPNTGVTLPTVAWCWMSCTHWLWVTSAWAGAASPKTAAAKPAAMALANPNFFMSKPFCFGVRAVAVRSRFGCLSTGSGVSYPV